MLELLEPSSQQSYAFVIQGEVGWSRGFLVK